jgi:hypothetical protein
MIGPIVTNGLFDTVFVCGTAVRDSGSPPGLDGEPRTPRGEAMTHARPVG